MQQAYLIAQFIAWGAMFLIVTNTRPYEPRRPRSASGIVVSACIYLALAFWSLTEFFETLIQY